MPIDLAVIPQLSGSATGSSNATGFAENLEQRVAALEATITELTPTKGELVELTEHKPLRALQAAHVDHRVQLLDAERAWTISHPRRAQVRRVDTE